ncbi:YczE/YyaS/YitT family protein [Salinibacillus xinjiangensis]|uniref:Membrane protein n=1 Tax=Salinibacillus xinjiangensis TaxID=1229268 RepID=A0A6G1X8L5_9BACI|nr:DUF6198 family protein [Salinibacillus xinjiangensis]MRG87245.1 membrane protein [Salinibacillus xinjiangensis]
MNKTRSLCYIIGLLIVTLGISLTIKSDMGVGAWDALHVGLSKLLFTVGTWVIITGTMLIIINAILLKRKPDVYAFITIFIMGPAIDLWLWLLNIEPYNLMMKFVIFTIGLLVLSTGVSIYLQAKFAPAPIDNLMIAIHTRFHVKLSVAKTIGEVIALIFALIFKGPIGIGTILVTFLVGPIIQVIYPRVEKIVGQFS